MLSFTAPVVLSGSIVADAGDPDLYFTDVDGPTYVRCVASRTEDSFDDVPFSAGPSMIAVYAYAEDSSGEGGFSMYTLSLSTTAVS